MLKLVSTNITTYRPSSLLHALLNTSEPKGFKFATKHPGWLATMNDELTALHSNKTWELVPRPPNTNIVGSKWVFRTKYLSEGYIDRFKARLVAQGFTQTPGLDYDHTFSPVVKASTVRVILTLAVMQHWPLHQLDVNNAFLKGLLSNPVYMEQPPGFIDPRFPHHVCCLRKALYGFKQAPIAWFQRFCSFLLHLGFIGSKANPSLFSYHHNTATLYLLVYVNDIILTGNNQFAIQTILAKIRAEFAIKDSGHLSYFLGLQVHYGANGIFLSQAKNAHDILERAKLLDVKSISTPLASGIRLTSTGDPFPNPTIYRSLVGALQYLTITHPDLSYVVNFVSQLLQAPITDHFQVVK